MSGRVSITVLKSIALWMVTSRPALATALSDYEPGHFEQAAGFADSDLLLLISSVAVAIALVWAAWAGFSVSLNTIAQGSYGTWLFMLAAIILIVTMTIVFVF